MGSLPQLKKLQNKVLVQKQNIKTRKYNKKNYKEKIIKIKKYNGRYKSITKK